MVVTALMDFSLFMLNKYITTELYVYFVNICLNCSFFNQRRLPREVDPLVYNMSHEDPGNITYSEIGGLNEQIRELREVDTVVKIHAFII